MTTASFLEKIDWSRPWLAHIQDTGRAVAAATDWRAELNRRAAAGDLRNHRGLPIRFVPQVELPAGVAYEAHISQTGGVPTRENLHDFFNALVWLTFPQIKVRLNALQAVELEKSDGLQAPARRGSLRDAATIFDENAVLLVTSNSMLVEALRRHQWMDAFIKHRSTFVDECRLYLFGHALMEKLVMPYKAITGHMRVLFAEAADKPDLNLGEIDNLIAAQMHEGLKTTDFSPLPTLGVPGWWADQDESFYLDTTVFRPAR